MPKRDNEQRPHITEMVEEVIAPDDSDPIPGVEDDRSATRAERIAEERAEHGEPKRSWLLTAIGILCILSGAAVCVRIVTMAITAGTVFAGDGGNSIISRILYIVLAVSVVATVASLIVLGVRLLRNKRRGARLTAELTILALLIDLACNIMLYGVSFDLAAYALAGFILVCMLTYIDPSLSQERKLQRKLRDMDTRTDAENGTLGRDKTGKGYIALDFFNLFWIFVIAAFLGDMVETVFHYLVVDPGVYQDRAGVLFGPFSPIYGFGAVLMTIALNRFHKAHLIVVFLVSAVIGGAFEYFTSWFLQFAFGVCAWDYSDTFLSIGGRTNFMFMCFWGLLGCLWVKLLLPSMLRVVNLIPWKWRYSITAVCALLMVADGAMTLIALDCWYERLAGQQPSNALAEFCAQHFDDQWMSERFQSMSIDPASSARTS